MHVMIIINAQELELNQQGKSALGFIVVRHFYCSNFGQDLSVIGLLSQTKILQNI
jgi:hypothetical protein